MAGGSQFYLFIHVASEEGVVLYVNAYSFDIIYILYAKTYNSIKKAIIYANAYKAVVGK